MLLYLFKINLVDSFDYKRELLDLLEQVKPLISYTIGIREQLNGELFSMGFVGIRPSDSLNVHQYST